MMANQPILSDQQPGFAGGLNTTADDFLCGVNQVRRADNARLSQFGSIIKRQGTQRLHAAAIGAIVRAGFAWRKVSSVENLLVANGNLYSAGSYAVPLALLNKGGTFTSAAYPDFEQFRDGSAECVYVSDGGLLNKYSDAGVLTMRIASTPAVAQLAVYNRRLFGVSGTDQTLYASALDNGDTLGIPGSGGVVAIVRTFGNQRLIAPVALRSSLALFHERGISRFTGYSQDDININAGVTGFSADTGTIAPRSIVAIDGDAYFLTERGAYHITDAGVQALDRSDAPDPTVAIIATMDSSKYGQISGVHDKANREVRWYLPDVGCYVYNYRLGAWTGPWTGVYAFSPTHCHWDTLDASGRPIVLFGSSDGFVRRADAPPYYRDDVLSDGSGGETYNLVLGLRRFYTDALESEKAPRFAWVFADIGSTTTALLSWSTAAGVGSYTLPGSGLGLWGTSTWGAFTWSESGRVRPYRVPLSGRGPWIDFTITDDGEAASIYSRVTFEAFDYGRRG